MCSSDLTQPCRRVFVSDFFDYSIYVDASEKDIRQWYIERFKKLQTSAFANPDSYFHQYASYDEETLRQLAVRVWEEINRPNLEQHILPTRFRADLIPPVGKEEEAWGNESVGSRSCWCSWCC